MQRARGSASLGGADGLGGAGGGGEAGSRAALEAENEGPVWAVSPHCLLHAGGRGGNLSGMLSRPSSVRDEPVCRTCGAAARRLAWTPAGRPQEQRLQHVPQGLRDAAALCARTQDPTFLNTNARRSCYFPAQPAQAWRRAQGRRGSRGNGTQLPSWSGAGRAAQQPPRLKKKKGRKEIHWKAIFLEQLFIAV